MTIFSNETWQYLRPLSILCSKQLISIDWNSQDRWNLFAIPTITKNDPPYLFKKHQSFVVYYERPQLDDSYNYKLA